MTHHTARSNIFGLINKILIHWLFDLFHFNCNTIALGGIFNSHIKNKLTIYTLTPPYTLVSKAFFSPLLNVKNLYI